MAKKVRGGPITVAGKGKVSLNAVTHGATAKKLINDEERQQYLTFIKDLNQHYPSTNPLVKWQIEKVARIKIQLDRFQNIMDASFRKSRFIDKVMDETAEFLKMDDLEKEQLSNFISGKTELDEKLINPLLKIFTQLIDLIEPEARTQQEFIERSPGFCNYIYDQAILAGISLEEFIKDELPKLSYFLKPNIENIIIAFYEMRAAKIESSDPMQKAILDANLGLLKQAAEHCSKEVRRVVMTKLNIIDFMKLKETIEEAMTPDIDLMDKLMRYQTTLQRQHSTAIGELLALTGNKP